MNAKSTDGQMMAEEQDTEGTAESGDRSFEEGGDGATASPAGSSSARAGAATGSADDASASAPERSDAELSDTEESAEDDAGAGELESLQAELDSLNERHLRLAAEFDNYRKRIGREREEMRTRAQADLVKGLLEVLDDLQRVAEQEAEAESTEALLEGVQLVEKKFRHALATAGLEPVQAAGEFFNPNTMEALMTVPAERPEEDDVVADVFQKGYRFGAMLIRPARVRVKKYEANE